MVVKNSERNKFEKIISVTHSVQRLEFWFITLKNIP
jgi:hypothetical protein